MHADVLCVALLEEADWAWFGLLHGVESDGLKLCSNWALGLTFGPKEKV